MKTSKGFYTVRGYQMLNAENRLLTSSMEDYLEMIYRICIEEEYVRIKQLAYRLHVRPSSATKVVQKLGELDLVDYEKYGAIKLTEAGREVGEFLLKRHEIIQEFLKNLGIEETLLKDTELIEHDISLSTLQSMESFNQFLSYNEYIKEQYKVFREEFYLSKENTI